MANNDFVKQIILKFKTEGSDQVKKVAESMGKNFNSREVDRFLKSMEQLNSKMGRAGGGMSVELKKVTEYFKELNNQHFTKAERNLDRLGRLLKNQIDNLDKLKREGAAADVIAQRESTMRRTAREFERIQEETPAPTRGGIKQVLSQIGGGGRFGPLLGALNIGASAAGLAAQYYTEKNRFQTESIQNRMSVANRFKQDAFDIFNGDMSKAVVYSKPGAGERIENDVERLTDSKTKSVIGRSIATLLGAAGGGALLGAGAGALGFGVGAIPGAVVGAVGGLIKGGYDIATYYKGGGKEEYKKQARELAIANESSKSLNPEYYKYFAERAESRYQYQRQLQMGDSQAMIFRRNMRDAGVLDEGEMANTATQFRRFGTGNAKNMAIRAANLAKDLGQDLSTTTNLMSQVGMSVRGGPQNANRELMESFRIAVKNGVNDSALIEEYTKQSAALLEISKGRMDMTQASEILGRFMTGGTERDIEGAKGAMASFGRTVSGTTGLMQQKKTAGILDLARGENGQVDMLTFKMLSDMSDEELSNLDKTNRLEELGIDKTKYDKFIKQQVVGTRMSGVGAREAQSLIEKAKKDGTLSVGDLDKLASAYGKNTGTPEEIRGFLKNTLRRELSPDEFDKFQFQVRGGGTVGMQAVADSPEQVLESIKTNTTGTSAGVAVGAKAEGQSKLDELVYKNIESNMEAINEIFKKQSQVISSQIDSDVLGKPIERIASAADSLATALESAAEKVNNSALTRTKSK